MSKRKNKENLTYGLRIGDEYKKPCDLTLAEVIFLYKEFYVANNRLPKSYDMASGNNIPSWNTVNSILNISNVTREQLNFSIIGYKQDYEHWVNRYLEISNQLGKPLNYRDLTNNKWGLPSARWFVNNCTDKNISDFNQFIEWCGFKPNRNISKKQAMLIILNMQSKKVNPLLQDDFNNPKIDEIGISAIYKIWGSFNNMKKELGLEIVQEDMMHKSRSFEELKKDIIYLCSKIYTNENRKVITLKDIDKEESLLSSQLYSKIFIENNTTLREFIESLGFSMLDAGRGLNFTFDDGEKIKSSYEYEFSKYLKEVLKLEFGKDYTRDILYKTFIKGDYKRKLDCDYIINYQSRKIYIEVTGLLRDYEKYYYDNKVINSSKSKEKYRLTLMEKEKMLKDNNLEYYLLFPINKNSLDFDKINEIFN